MIKKVQSIKIKNAYLLVLLFGLISTVFGGAWVIIINRFVNDTDAFGLRSYPSVALGEVMFCAALHIVCGIILFIDERKKVE